MLTNNYWFNAPAGDAEFYSHKIDQSVRFDGSAHLSRTMVAGSRQKMTFSTWIKRSELSSSSANLPFFTAHQNSFDRVHLYFSSAHKLTLYGKVGNQQKLYAYSNEVLRDTSGWMHIVVTIDTAEATSTDRVKMYVNGSQIALTQDTIPDQDQDLEIGNSGTLVKVGGQDNTYGHFDGYFADTIYLDGTIKSAADFGMLKEGVWVPKEYTGGGYGNNGFHLDYAAVVPQAMMFPGKTMT